MGLEANELPEEVSEIPQDITAGKFITITKLKGGNGKAPIPGQHEVIGKLTNPPIRVGEQILLSMGRTTVVTKISQEDNNFRIFTESGSEYLFEPKRSLPML